MKKGRMEFLDSLKGFAIFLVVWGHSIQYFRNSGDCFENHLFEFIYSFHMPLFFLISGFLFSSNLKYSFVAFSKKKFRQLLLPNFIWTFIFFSFNLMVFLFGNGSINLKDEIITLILPTRWAFWFLTDLFVSYVIVFIAIKLFKKDWIAVIVSVCIVLIAPYGNYQRYLLPVFWFGYFVKKYDKFIFEHINEAIVLSGAVFLICLVFWKGSYTVYETPLNKLLKIRTLTVQFNSHTFLIALYRLIIGIAGSLFFFLIFKTIKWINIFNPLIYIGRYTLALYVLHIIIIRFILNDIIDFSVTNIWLYSLLITPLLSVLLIGLCMLLFNFFNKNKYVSYFLFGSSYQ